MGIGPTPEDGSLKEVVRSNRINCQLLKGVEKLVGLLDAGRYGTDKKRILQRCLLIAMVCRTIVEIEYFDSKKSVLFVRIPFISS